MKIKLKTLLFTLSAVLFVACGSSVSKEDLTKAVEYATQKDILILTNKSIKVLGVILKEQPDSEFNYKGRLLYKRGSSSMRERVIEVKLEDNDTVVYKIDSEQQSFNLSTILDEIDKLPELKKQAEENVKVVQVAINSVLVNHPELESHQINDFEIIRPYMGEALNSESKMKVAGYKIRINRGEASYPGLTK